MPAKRSDPERRRAKLIMLIHVGKKALDLDDETYRALLAEETGLYSCAAMAVWQLEKVLKRMRRSGFRSQQKRQEPDLQSGKIVGLWRQLHRAGKVRDPSVRALNHWVKRQTGVEALNWLSSDQASTCIESLKQWLARQ